MKRTTPVKPPTRKELFTLRFMIILGLASMFFFIRGLVAPGMMGSKILYYTLIFTILFTCFKILIEWIHYFYITVPETPPQHHPFTVDILTTFCAGEPYEMIVTTLEAIQKINYPHETYLCDEANDPYLIEVCKRLGVHHVTRTHKINAKAGNINNALKYAKGELCVVLDPDHVPFPDFLDPIVSHFNDPKVGFVQIVQAYYNHNESLIAKGAAQQTFQFYGPIMMTMNKYGTVLAIGANCTFRRAAIDSIGGHAAGLAEDMHTAMQLHAKGWKSVYVPSVLARGLVPSTLSAYYSQQLKWSRGVFDLFVTAYPKLFKNFTWKQKLHYGLIPLHYFSGVIFLLNFLIPVLSLFFDRSPIKIDLINFGILGFPLFTSIILIRQFMQWWVMEDDERGFHIVGGLLMIGSWWVFITGLFYTIIGKKVPYIPTPKDDTEENNWPLNIPNLVIIFISIVAIVYGIYTNWSPYMLIMAGFAAMNCFILLFTVVASRQNHLRKFRGRNDIIDRALDSTYGASRRIFGKIKRRIYMAIRSSALILTVLVTCIVLYILDHRARAVIDTVNQQQDNSALISGIYLPQQPNGLTSVSLLKQFEGSNQLKFGIVSLYRSWGDEARCDVPIAVMDSIYKNNAIPMLTWEPWQQLFKSTQKLNHADKEKQVFKRILAGEYDNYIDRFSKQLAAIDRPVFLRFAHEADNPYYPWSATGANTPEDFKQAWKYVYERFTENKAYNVIWVWNPWKATAIDSYYPGDSYVDWLGVTDLNYGKQAGSTGWYSMAQLYQPFHNNPVFRSGLPVMLAETGSLASEGRQQEWFMDGFKSIKTKFPEIKGFVLFYSGTDKSNPNAINFDWRAVNPKMFADLWIEKKINNGSLHYTDLPTAATPIKTSPLYNNIVGVKYAKGKNWFNNYQVVSKSQIIYDLNVVKKLGFNTIKLYGGVYDDIILSAAKNSSLNVTYCFWVPDDFYNKPDFDESKLQADIIKKKINSLKGDKTIISWNISNPVMYKMAGYYGKPEAFYKQGTYVQWLKKLIKAVKVADPNKPVSVDVDARKDLLAKIDILHKTIPEIDAFGLISGENLPFDLAQLQRINAPYFFSKIDAGNYLNMPKQKTGFFIANWQDETTTNNVTFDGLNDKWGESKIEFYQIYNRFKGAPMPELLPPIKVLIPAITIFEGDSIAYKAIMQKKGKWEIIDPSKTGLQVKWELVKNDNYGNHISSQFLGNGPVVSFNAPDYANYELYLYVNDDKMVRVVKSKLNTPLVSK